jgi:hypothetical protein
MVNYNSSFANGAAVDALLTTVNGSNLSATHKITRSATLVVAASDSSAKSKAQADYVCDGTTDATTIQTALTAVSSAGGGRVILLEGQFNLSKEIILGNNTTIEGQGNGTVLYVSNVISSVLTADANTGQANITVTDGTKFYVGQWVAVAANNSTAHYSTKCAETGQIQAINGNVITMGANLANSYTTSQTATLYSCHSAILINGLTYYVTIKNLKIDGNKSHQGAIQPLVIGTSGEERRCSSGIAAYLAKYLTIQNVNVVNSNLHNLSMDSCDYCDVSEKSLFDACNDKNILAMVCTYCKFIGLHCSNSVNEDGINLYSTNTNCQILSCTCKSNGRNGIYSRGTNNIIIGNICTLNTSNGINVAYSTYPEINENVCYSNTAAGISISHNPQTDVNGVAQGNICYSNGTNGISNVRCNNMNIIGNSCIGNTGNGFEFGVSDKLILQQNRASGNVKGINSDSNTTNSTFSNNYISGNTTAIVSPNSTNKTSENIGYVTSNRGTGTITAGQTTVDVTHGLAAAPTRVLLTPTTATAGKQYYVSAKAASTFTITIDSAHSADITFDWQAVI